MTSMSWVYAACIHTYWGDFGLSVGGTSGGATPSSAAYPAANDGLFFPFYIPNPFPVKRLYVLNGAAVSGSIDVGIYSEGLTRIISAGSTLHSGTNTLQFFNNTDFLLGAGRYYFAVAINNGGSALFRNTTSAAFLRGLGAGRMGSAFPLPDTATLAAFNSSYLPMIGAEVIRVL